MYAISLPFAGISMKRGIKIIAILEFQLYVIPTSQMKTEYLTWGIK